MIPHWTRHFLFQLLDPPLQELPLPFLLGQGQRLLVRRPSLSCPAEPAMHWTTVRKRYQGIVRYLGPIVFPFLVRSKSVAGINKKGPESTDKRRLSDRRRQ